jgi:AraC-like DNA-binding protein
VPYVTHRPVAPLSAAIDYLWCLNDVPAHGAERVLPTGTLELVINLHDDVFDIRRGVDAPSARRFSGAMVSGAYSSYFVIDPRAHANLLGVHFKPGAARAILGIPPGSLADEHVDLEVLWGPAARELRERLGTATNVQHRFEILETALLRQLTGPVGRHGAVELAIQRLACDRHPVGQVAAELGMTRRRFIELFTSEVGMTPKLFFRVQRFQGALKRAGASGRGWVELALAAGYCDQSHLVRDFASFSGFAPTELIRHMGPDLKEHHVRAVGKISPRRP